VRKEVGRRVWEEEEEEEVDELGGVIGFRVVRKSWSK